jgi:hypothetical protein
MLIKIKPVRKQTFLGRFIDMPYNITYIWEYIGNNMKINEALKDLRLNWQTELQKDEWFFAKARDKIDAAFTSEDAFSAIMEVVFFIQSETDPYLCTECVELLYSLIRKSDTTEIPQDFLQSFHVLKEKLAKDTYSLNILQEIEAHYRI